MTLLNYTPAIAKRSTHILEIESESITTTHAKEVLAFAKERVKDKDTWKLLKEAVRLGEPLVIAG